MYAKKHLIFTVLALLLFFLFGWKFAEYNLANQKIIIETEDGPRLIEAYDNPQHVNLNLFWEVWEKLEFSYLDHQKTTDDQDLIYGSIKGLTDALDDPYTVFMTPEETKQFDDNLNNHLEGIGAELTVEEGLLVVLSPLKNSPAEAAGLLPGDIIYQIDGDPTSDLTLYDAIMKIRGEKGTSVILTIIRIDEDMPFDVTIKRETIEIDSVVYELLDGEIGYVEINQFSETTGEEFDEAVNQILLDDPKGLIVDLRFNGGGFLDISVDILSELIDNEKIAVQIATKHAKENEIVAVWDDARLPEIPLVMLVNFGSASASEIMAGAVQDHKRGLIIGEQTYGKGSVQELQYFNDGSSLRLTVAKWLTPNGRDIDKVGITPDRIVEFDYAAEPQVDNQLEEAMDYLKNL